MERLKKWVQNLLNRTGDTQHPRSRYQSAISDGVDIHEEAPSTSTVKIIGRNRIYSAPGKCHKKELMIEPLVSADNGSEENQSGQGVMKVDMRHDSGYHTTMDEQVITQDLSESGSQIGIQDELDIMQVIQQSKMDSADVMSALIATSAWNTLIQGHKRWVLIHPNETAELVKPQKNKDLKHPDEAVTWFNAIYKRVRSSSWPKEYPVIEARPGPGETMFVPSGWWHVVINEDETIAITQNFCSIANLRHVWPKTVRGRPNLSKHWLRRLAKERPELLPLMESSLFGSLNDGHCSTSCSSSDDCTSEDSDCQNSNKMITANRRCDGSDSDDSFCSEKPKKSYGAYKDESYA